MLDNTDIQILNELKKNSRITMKELGERVHLTGAAVAARVSKLEDNGLIDSYTISVNQKKLGYPVHVIINILLTKIDNHNLYLSFINTQKKFVIKNYKVSGDGCYIIEAKFPTNALLDEFLTKLNEYVNYRVNIVLNETLKNNQIL